MAPKCDFLAPVWLNKYYNAKPNAFAEDQIWPIAEQKGRNETFATSTKKLQHCVCGNWQRRIVPQSRAPCGFWLIVMAVLDLASPHWTDWGDDGRPVVLRIKNWAFVKTWTSSEKTEKFLKETEHLVPSLALKRQTREKEALVFAIRRPRDAILLLHLMTHTVLPNGASRSFSGLVVRKGSRPRTDWPYLRSKKELGRSTIPQKWHRTFKKKHVSSFSITCDLRQQFEAFDWLYDLSRLLFTEVTTVCQKKAINTKVDQQTYKQI